MTKMDAIPYLLLPVGEGSLQDVEKCRKLPRHRKIAGKASPALQKTTRHPAASVLCNDREFPIPAN